jgi:hypothetical protein
MSHTVHLNAVLREKPRKTLATLSVGDVFSWVGSNTWYLVAQWEGAQVFVAIASRNITEHRVTPGCTYSKTGIERLTEGKSLIVMISVALHAEY